MIVFEITDDKFGKVMKAVSEIGKHSECLTAIFEDLAEESEYNEKSHRADDDMYGSRYGMRRGIRRSY
jgi:hypothetical protein